MRRLAVLGLVLTALAGCDDRPRPYYGPGAYVGPRYAPRYPPPPPRYVAPPPPRYVPPPRYAPPPRYVPPRRPYYGRY